MLITSMDNENIKLYRKLVSSKKDRDKTNKYTLEGTRILCEAIKENADIELVFSTTDAYEKNKEMLLGVKEKIIFIEESLSKKLSDTKTPQGVFAILNKIDDESVEVLPDGKYIVLNNVQDPGNVGTILRTADAVGLTGVILTNNCADLYNQKTVRSTMGSMFRLNIIKINDFCDVINLLKKSNIKTYATVIDSDAKDIKGVNFETNSAVVIGNEGNGLSDEDKSLCDERITIKMNGNIDSLNASVASAITLWEMTK